MYFLYNIIKKENSQNIELFINKPFESYKLFNLLSNDKYTDHFALSVNIIIYDNLIECYYTNFNLIDKFYITKLSFNKKTKFSKIIDIKTCFLGMVAYNFKLLYLSNNELLAIGGHHPEISNIYIKEYYKYKGETFYDRRFDGHPYNHFPTYKCNNKSHSNGIYVISNFDNNASYYKGHNLPVIHLKSNHVNKNQNIDFDSFLSIVYSNKLQKYILCTRSNIKSNTRFISYSMSDDLINWKAFK